MSAAVIINTGNLMLVAGRQVLMVVYQAVRFATVVGVVVIACGLSHVRNCQAAESAPSDSQPIIYRHVMVPADSPASWPVEGEAYLPVDKNDFDAWVAAANGRAATAWMSSAEYQARLEGTRLVDGQGTWNVSLDGDQTAYLPLAESTLVVDAARWRNGRERSAAAARLGVWPRSDGMSYALEVTRAGVVEFDWHTLPGTDHGDHIEIPLRLPTAAKSELKLKLPAGLRPVMDGCVVTGVAEPPSPDGLRSWELVIGGATNGRLRINRENAPPEAKPPTFDYREEVQYHVDTCGLNVATTLHINRRGEPLHELRVAVPDALQIVAATANGQAVECKLLAGAPSDVVEAIVNVPNSPWDQEPVVTLHAWAAPVMDQSWTLPKLRIKGGEWTTGSIEIAVAEPLELGDLQPMGCIQTGIQTGVKRNVAFDRSDASDPLQAASKRVSGEIVDVRTLQSYSPDARAAVLIVPQAAAGSVRSTATLEVGVSSIQGTMAAQIDVEHGKLFSATAMLQPGWSIDAVETTTPEALDEWFVTSPAGQRAVELRFARAVTPIQPVTVRLSAVRRGGQAAAFQSLYLRSLEPVRWRDLDVERNLLCLNAADPYELVVLDDYAGESAIGLTGDRQTPDEADNDGKWFDLRPVAVSTTPRRIQLMPTGSSYDANVRIDATVQGSRLRTNYRITSQPQHSGIDELLVYCSAPLAEPIQWLNASTGEPLTAVQVSDDPRTSSVPAEGQLWRLSLGRTYAGAISVTGTAQLPLGERLAVPIVSLPEAANGEGRVAVNSANGTVPTIDVEGLVPVPLPTGAAVNKVVATYRYEPIRFYGAGPSPQLWLGAPSESSQARPLVARSATLESFCAAGGDAVHRLAYRLQRSRATSVELVLPPNSAFDSATLDGRPLLPANDASLNRGKLKFALPNLFAESVLVVRFGTRSAQLVDGNELSPPLPQSNVTVLAGQWKVWLPTEFAIDEGEHAFDWRQRLFGPLARPAEQRPFNPLRLDDWFGIFPNGSAIEARADPTVPSAAIGRDANRVQLAQFEAEVSRPQTSPNDTAVLPNGEQPTTAAPRGWNCFESGFGVQGPRQIAVVHPRTTAAWSLAMFFVCLSVFTLYRPKAVYVVALLTLAIVLCVLLPAADAPIATAAFWGLAISPLSRWLMRQRAAAATSSGRDRRSGYGSTVAMTPLPAIWIAVGLSVALAGAAGAQENAREHNDGDAPKIHRVLVPVGDAGKPVGTKYFLSESFAKQLLKLAERNNSSRRMWVLNGMTIVGNLDSASKGAGTALSASEGWSLSCDVEVFARDTAIELPLVRKQATWAAMASLDGIPTSLEWNEAGDDCRMRASEPGRYQLVIRFEPQRTTVGGRSRVELDLPPLPGAVLQLGAPESVATITLNGVSLERPTNDAATDWRHELDGTGKVALEWSDPAKEAGASVSRIDQLYWLRVEANETLLDVKYVPTGRGSSEPPSQLPNEVVLRVPRHYELLSDVADGTRADGKPLSDGRQLITIHAGPDSRRDAGRDLQLRFRLREGSPFGRLQIAPIETTSFSVNRHWLAVSANPAFECTTETNSANTGATIDDFAAAWGTINDERPPQIVLTGAELQASTVVAVVPDLPATEHVEQLLVAVRESRLDVVYQTEVTPHGANCFCWSLTVPNDFEIAQIAAETADAPVPLRWVRVADDQVNVFFNRKVADPYQLTLAGEVPLPGLGEHRLPQIFALNAPLVPQTFLLYRDERVLLAVNSDTSATTADLATTPQPPADWNARLVDRFSIGALGELQLHTTANHVQLTGQTLTQVDDDNGVWSTTYAARFRVEQGELDTFRCRVPSSWLGPFEIQPTNATIELTPMDDDSAMLTVRFPGSFTPGDEVQLVIRGPLSFGSGQTVAVPQIVPQADGALDHFVTVPKAVDATALSWSRSGVETVDSPPDVALDSTERGEWQTLRVTTEPFRVALRTPQQAPAPSEIPLAETRAVVGSAGGLSMVTRFTIAPHGISECVLQLPPDQRLVDVSLDGHPALTRPLDDARHCIQLGSPDLPQTLDVVTRIDSDTASDLAQFSLRRPMLVQRDQPLPVEVSLWSVCRPAVVATEVAAEAAPLTPSERAALRLERLVSISEGATRAVIEAPVVDGYHWFARWSQTLTRAEQAVQANRDQPVVLDQVPPEVARTDDPGNQAIDRSEAWRTQAEELFAISGAAGEQTGDVTVVEADPFEIGTPPGYVWSHYVAAGRGHGLPIAGSDANRLGIELDAHGLSPLAVRVVAITCAVVLAAAIGWFVSQPVAGEFVARWRYALAVLVGLATWAWLRPSWIGVAVAALCLVLWLREILFSRRSLIAESSGARQ